VPGAADEGEVDGKHGGVPEHLETADDAKEREHEHGDDDQDFDHGDEV